MLAYFFLDTVYIGLQDVVLVLKQTLIIYGETKNGPFLAHIYMWNLKNLKCSSHTCYYCSVRDRNSRIYPISTMASKFTGFESSCTVIARESVKNMHQWSGRTKTATENGMGQAGSCCHCCSHSSVASSIGPDWWCMLCAPSVAIFRTRCNQLDSKLSNLEATVEVG